MPTAYIENGDYVYNGAGGLRAADDEREAAVRRCLERLRARRGGCVLDASFGSTLWQLGREARRGRETAALRAAAEALEPEGAEVLAAEVVERADGLEVTLALEPEGAGAIETVSVTV